MPSDDRIELEPATGLRPRADLRPHMPEPPPVKLLAVADVHLPSAAGYERDLDAFYVDVLKFERAEIRDRAAAGSLNSAAGGENVLAYRAENHAIVFDVLEPPLNRDDITPTAIEVPSLRELRFTLVDREIAFQATQGLDPATEFLLLKDPTGNWLSISEWRAFR